MVSYISTPIQSSEYILPVDLNLLGRVNQYKQTLFYNNASQLKQQYSLLKNTDILNEKQKNKLDESYTKLVNQLKSAGSLDFSDLNVVGQVERLGSQLYEDPEIMNGIVSTKKVRKLHSMYDKMKTDPKLMKYYSEANEWHDNLAVSDYITGDVDASYNGSGSPTMYLGNTFDLYTKKIKEIRPDVEVGFTMSGEHYYYNKYTGETVDSDKIYAMLQGSLTPELINQMQIEGLYRGRGMTNDDIKRSITLDYESKVRHANANIDRINKLIATSVKTDEKADYENQLLQQTLYLEDLEAKYNDGLLGIDDKLNTREGRMSILGSIYTQELTNNAITAYSYKKIKNEAALDQSRIHMDKMNLARDQMAQRDAHFKEELEYKYASLGSKTKTDQDGIPGMTGAYEVGGTYQDNTGEIMVTPENIDTQINGLADNNTKLLIEYFSQNGGSQYVKDLKMLANLDNDQRLSQNDFDILLKRGTIPGVGSLYKESNDYFTKIAQLWTKAATGDITALENTTFNVADFKQVYDQIVLNNVEIQWRTDHKNKSIDKGVTNYIANNNLNSSLKPVLSGLYKGDSKYITSTGRVKIENLTPQQIKELEDKKIIQTEYKTTGRVLSYTIDEFGVHIPSEYETVPTGTYIYNKDVINKTVKTQQKEYFKDDKNNVKIGQTTKHYVINKKVDKYNDALRSFLKSDYKTLTGDKLLNDALDSDKIQIDYVRYSTPSAGFKGEIVFTYLGGDSPVQYRKEVDPSVLEKQYGVEVPPKVEFMKNETLMNHGKLPTEKITVDGWGKNNAVEYQIVKNGDRVFVNITLGSEPIQLGKGFTNGQFVKFESYFDANEYVRALFKTAGNMKREDFYQQLLKISREY